ncbi:hypothetical protein D3C75_1313940 [compost metagenome]
MIHPFAFLQILFNFVGLVVLLFALRALPVALFLAQLHDDVGNRGAVLLRQRPVRAQA